MKVLRLVVLMVLVVGVAGCGDDDDDAAVTTSVPSAAASAAGAGGGEADVLTATVGEEGKPDAFTITLEDASGAAVSTLPAGAYQIEVSDPSKIHNAHLSGAGVDEKTSVPETAEVTWTVQLTAGAYTLVCDPHSKMKVELTVT